MRQVFLDTETTGLYPAQGHRIIEIAAIEVVNRRVTNNHFHVYLNPDREIDPAAQEVHGITLEFLQDKPRFPDIVNEFLDFVADAELVIHNAPFDTGFLNAELGKIDRENLEKTSGNIVDTLKMAKEMRPGQRNNLDALCRHFGIDNSKRTLHGALLDAELLADVYMAMTRGQESLMMEILEDASSDDVDGELTLTINLKVLHASGEELEEHEAYVKALNKGDNLWRQAVAESD
ncbi:DNA polymerase III subunit epsilon [Candidatus Methylopumilus turicensis]|uniref:DNA polymerase III subunit epsilon n=1 Tax=Candidatus Methylopumilus turicensis TaxID=1581680 RepID=A0A0B7J063_9PROT|nr:DNA polymerase III subunit epsilon [Candidatus Methylopumilus turicensis]CEN56053.1 DNA polymerase III, epsilon subunit [Candidatus Methylopumilus turicensis]